MVVCRLQSLMELALSHIAACPPQAAEPLWRWSSADCTQAEASLLCCESSMGLVPQGCPCPGTGCPRLQVPLECPCCGVGCPQATFYHGCSCPTVVMMVINYYYFSCCYISFKAGWFWFSLAQGRLEPPGHHCSPLPCHKKF